MLCGNAVVGRIMKVHAAPEGSPWMWTLAFGHHCEHRIPVRRSRSRHEVKQFYIRFCFPDAANADAFNNRFSHRISPSRGPLAKLLRVWPT